MYNYTLEYIATWHNRNIPVECTNWWTQTTIANKRLIQTFKLKAAGVKEWINLIEIHWESLRLPNFTMLRLAAGLLLSAAASELELTSNIFTIYFKFTSSILQYVSNTSEIYFKYLKRFLSRRQNDVPASGSMLKMCPDLLFARQSLLVKHNVHSNDMSHSYTYIQHSQVKSTFISNRTHCTIKSCTSKFKHACSLQDKVGKWLS